MLFEYETNRLILKVLKPDWAPSVLDFYLRDKELFETYEPDRIPKFYTVSHQKTLLKCEYNLAFKQQTIRYYVFLKSNPNQIIGTICFHNIMKTLYSSCELGYKFSSEFHHQGYATEAISHGLDMIFSELGLHRVIAWVLPENEPSLRLLARIGFIQEGVCRSMLPMKGQWRDHIQLSLISPLQ